MAFAVCLTAEHRDHSVPCLLSPSPNPQTMTYLKYRCGYAAPEWRGIPWGPGTVPGNHSRRVQLAELSNRQGLVPKEQGAPLEDSIS